MGAGKTALVLSGGGTLGAVQVGFLRRLSELGVPIDFVVYLASTATPGTTASRRSGPLSAGSGSTGGTRSLPCAGWLPHG